MDAGEVAEVDEDAFGGRQMGGFKDFYQYTWQTRVIAGRGLLDSIGFEFMKEGARRVFVVTDKTIRGTGLVERVEGGVVDGGLELAGVFDDVPQDSGVDTVEACAAGGGRSASRQICSCSKVPATASRGPTPRRPTRRCSSSLRST